MKVVDVIKKGFDITNNSMKLVLVVFIFNLVWNLGVIPFTPEAPVGIGADVAMPPALTIISLIFMFISIFIQGGVLGSVRDIVKENNLDLGRFTGYGAKFYVRLLAVAFIILLIIAVIAFIATLIVAASAPTGNTFMVIITTIVALIVGGVGVYLVVLLFLSPYILVLEDTGVIESMKRSVAFVKQFLMNVLGLGLLLVLIGFGIGLLMGILAGIISLVIKGKFLQAVTGILNGGINAYLTILVTTCFVSYYLALKDSGQSQTQQPA